MNTVTKKQDKQIHKTEMVDATLGWKTTMFNDDTHSFDEVIIQVIKAISCSYEEARRYTYIAHTSGSATIYKGTKKKCEAVAKILGDIHLRTVVTQ